MSQYVETKGNDYETKIAHYLRNIQFHDIHISPLAWRRHFLNLDNL